MRVRLGCACAWRWTGRCRYADSWSRAFTKTGSGWGGFRCVAGLSLSGLGFLSENAAVIERRACRVLCPGLSRPCKQPAVNCPREFLLHSGPHWFNRFAAVIFPPLLSPPSLALFSLFSLSLLSLVLFARFFPSRHRRSVGFCACPL